MHEPYVKQKIAAGLQGVAKGRTVPHEEIRRRLTRQFRETVHARAQRDARFHRALLTEAVNELLAGDHTAGKALLRDYINATLGFERLGAEVERSPKSLQRMLGPSGNPTAGNLIAILKALQAYEGVILTVRLDGMRREGVAGVLIAC